MMYQAIVDGEKNDSDTDVTSSSLSSWTLLQSHCIDLAKDTKVGDGEIISPMDVPIGSSSSSSTGNIYATLFHPSSSSSSSSRSLTLALPLEVEGIDVTSTNNFGQVASTCPLSSGGYCCLAFLPNNDIIARSGSDSSPVIALRHPMSGGGRGLSSSSSASHFDELPYKLEAEAHTKRGSTARGGEIEWRLWRIFCSLWDRGST